MSPGPALTIGTLRTDPVVVIQAAGEMDASSINLLETAIDDAIRDHERHVVLDAREISFIDSTGITALVSGLRRLNRARRRLALACTPEGPLGRALALTGLDHTFECFTSAEDAVTALESAPLLGR